jgi:hypothetical protein
MSSSKTSDSRSLPMPTGKISYIHLRHASGEEGDQVTVHTHGGITIAYAVEGDQALYAVARCYHGDNYVKKTGRIKSTARLQSAKMRHVVALTDEQKDKPLEAVLNDFWTTLDPTHAAVIEQDSTSA